MFGMEGDLRDEIESLKQELLVEREKHSELKETHVKRLAELGEAFKKLKDEREKVRKARDLIGRAPCECQSPWFPCSRCEALKTLGEL